MAAEGAHPSEGQRARERLERALGIFEAAYGPDHPHTTTARRALEGL